MYFYIYCQRIIWFIIKVWWSHFKSKSSLLFTEVATKYFLLRWTYRARQLHVSDPAEARHLSLPVWTIHRLKLSVDEMEGGVESIGGNTEIFKTGGYQWKLYIKRREWNLKHCNVFYVLLKCSRLCKIRTWQFWKRVVCSTRHITKDYLSQWTFIIIIPTNLSH